LIKCKKYIDQKEQDKLAVQAGDQQNHYKQQKLRRTDSPWKFSSSYGQIYPDKTQQACEINLPPSTREKQPKQTDLRL
jgi:hypothetical protein